MSMLAPEWKLLGRYLVFLSLVITMGFSLTWLRWNSYCTVCWSCACCLAFLRMGCSLTWPRWNSCGLLSMSMLLGIPQNGLLSHLTQMKYLQSAELEHAAWHSSNGVALLSDPSDIVVVCWAFACCKAFLWMACFPYEYLTQVNSCSLLSLSMLLCIPQNGLLSHLTQVK